MKILVIGALLVITLLATACGPDSVQSRGFSLPPGDVENGSLLFIEYQCIECHTLAGTDFVGDEDRLRENGGIAVQLGGSSGHMQTYGDLVTSIINPTHRIAKGYALEEVADNGESRMTYYNDILTVSDLIDLVAFLKSKYPIESYCETTAPYYIFPE